MKLKFLARRSNNSNRRTNNGQLFSGNLSAIFDKTWYTTMYPDYATSGGRAATLPLEHFITQGISNGYKPNALFDYKFYGENFDIAINGAKDLHAIMHHYDSHFESRLTSTHPIFDPLWYLNQNPDVMKEFILGRTFPLMHFIKFGSAEGRSPHPLFDAKWYLATYSDADLAFREQQITAINHYIMLGASKGYSPSENFNANWYASEHSLNKDDFIDGKFDALSHYLYERKSSNIEKRSIVPIHSADPRSYLYLDENKQTKARALRQWSLSARPLVSIIIVNHDGSIHLPMLIEGLEEQTYSNFEVIFVDNGSNDNSCAIMQNSNLRVKVINLSRNYGFAESNNIGLDHSRGELLAVLNNDTRPNSTWLESLVNLMVRTPDAGAITPKLLFWTKFTSLRFESKYSFSINKRVLIDNLDYKKCFVDAGDDTGEFVKAINIGAIFLLELKVPIHDSPLNFSIRGSVEHQIVKLSNELHALTISATDQEKMITYQIGLQSKRLAKHVINNAGSGICDDLQTFDRGIGEYDLGQYNSPERIPLFCGCAALIRRDALLGYELFPSEFVAYYEDSELSLRIQQNGMFIYYEPNSVVHHKHSSTSVERSEFWMTYVNRNRVLFDYMFSRPDQRDARFQAALMTFNHHEEHFRNKDKINTENDRNYANALPHIVKDLLALKEKIDAGKMPSKRQPRIGIFNNFWQTLGGGEAHALSFLDILSSIGVVELISVNDFDIDHLMAYFGRDINGVVKRIVIDMTPTLTSEYDIFINSTYMNECPSEAKRSLYLVSFPSSTPSAEFLSSYHFVANSNYTLGWMEQMWSNHKFTASVYYPAVSDNLVSSLSEISPIKQKLIVSVGRFFKSGHSKNQHIIASIFKKFVAATGNMDWKLVLVGSSNDYVYVEEIRQILDGYNFEIIVNASIEEVARIYENGSIYIHASGYGQDINSRPENFEHFGMTVAEAVLNGCYPIVYNAAGPREIVRMLEIGCCYDNIDAAVAALIDRISGIDAPSSRYLVAEDIRSRAAEKLFTTRSTENKSRLRHMLTKVGVFDHE
ncbi:glycosyltransferase [Methylorubrum thiocyanatum]|uniref:glycosyltransferase n=1 Tax=Methylorubrum thiocyanatum TaxID=47958 RepID=UPI00383A1B6B